MRIIRIYNETLHKAVHQQQQAKAIFYQTADNHVDLVILTTTIELEAKRKVGCKQGAKYADLQRVGFFWDNEQCKAASSMKSRIKK